MVLKIYHDALNRILDGGVPRMPSQREVVDIMNREGLDYYQRLRPQVPLGSGSTARSKIVRAERRLMRAGLLTRDEAPMVTPTGKRLIRALKVHSPDVELWPAKIEVKPSPTGYALYYLAPDTLPMSSSYLMDPA